MSTSRYPACKCLENEEKYAFSPSPIRDVLEGEEYACIKKVVPRRIRIHHDTAVADYFNIMDTCFDPEKHHPWTTVKWEEIPYWLTEMGFSGQYVEKELDWIEHEEQKLGNRVSARKHESRLGANRAKTKPYPAKLPKLEKTPEKKQVVKNPIRVIYVGAPPCLPFGMLKSCCLLCDDCLTEEDFFPC